jgi:hypothetical protein
MPEPVAAFSGPDSGPGCFVCVSWFPSWLLKSKQRTCQSLSDNGFSLMLGLISGISNKKVVCQTLNNKNVYKRSNKITFLFDGTEKWVDLDKY